MCARHTCRTRLCRPPDCHCHSLKLVSMCSLHLFLIVTWVSLERLDT
jgi:hypothetical protein